MCPNRNRLPKALGVPVSRIGEIVNCRRAISSDTALRFARFFGTRPDFWMNLQTQFDLDSARQHTAAIVRREVRPLQRRTAVSGASS